MRKEPNERLGIGQLIMPRLEVDRFANDREYAEGIEQLVRDALVGGFCVFGGTAELVSNTVKRLQLLATGSPLLFSCDCEFGLPMRLATGGTEFPDAMAIAKTGETEYAFEVGQAIAREMRAIGLDWNFAPVVDVNSNPANPIINTRAFGDDPETVERFSIEFLRGLQTENVAATAKHFPGHGDTSVDSHRELPMIEKGWNEFSALELRPFQAAIEAGVASIMTGHLAAPNLATFLGAPPEEQHVPATLSRTLTTKLLRERLGFRGVIVTDALEMHAITKHFGEADAAVRAMAAGADVLLMPVDPHATHEAIVSAVDSGTLPLETIRASLERIEHLKERITSEPSRTPAAKLQDYSEAHSKLANEIARKAIELEGTFDPSNANFLILADDRSPVMEKVKLFTNSIASISRSVEMVTADAWPPRSFEFDQDTIIVTFYRARGYVGTHPPRSLTMVVRKVAQSLDDRRMAARGLILFGSPYLDREFKMPPGFVLKTFSESTPSIHAVIEMMNDAK